jgi:Right handed beta helix region
MKKMKVEEVGMKSHQPKAFTLLLSVLFSITVITFAGLTTANADDTQNNEIAITCGDQPGNQSISGVLARLDPTQQHTIRVSGTCKENVVIQSFDRLTLIANPGAAISDASAGNKIVVNIEDSQRITLQGFTINGGDTGVVCGNQSLCHFKGNTIQRAVNGDGVDLAGSQATFDGDVVQFNAGSGLFIADGAGALVSGARIQYNSGNGITSFSNTTLHLRGAQIMGNGGSGVSLDLSSVAIFGVGGNHATANIITNNGGPGVILQILSVAAFRAVGNTITLNNTSTGGTGFDVVCAPQFSATQGANSNIGGTTNCVEP